MAGSLYAETFDVELIGGDASSSSKLVIDSIVGGEAPKSMAVDALVCSTRRSYLCTTGTLGGASAGLQLLENDSRPNLSGSSPEDELVRKQLKPAPHVEIGKLLREKGLASAMIDVSDGLSTDLGHLCDASGVGALLDASVIPVDPDIAALALSEEERLEFALNGGEDFVLLFTAPNKIDMKALLPEVYRVGEITETVGQIQIIGHGIKTDLPRKGFQHF